MNSKNILTLLKYFTSSSSASIFSFIILSLYIRFFSSQDFARINLVLVSITTTGTILTAGVGLSNIVNVKRKINNLIPKLIRISFRYLLFAIIPFALLNFYLERSITIALISIISVLLFSSFSFSLWALNAVQNTRHVIIIQNLKYFSYFIMTSVGIFYFKIQESNNFLYYIISSFILSDFIPIIFLEKKYKLLNMYKSISNKGLIKPDSFLEKFSNQSTFWYLLWNTLTYSDRYLMTLFISRSSIGIYSSIYDIFNRGIAFINLPIYYTYVPIIMEQKAIGDSQGANKLINKINLIQMALLVMLCGFTSFFWKEISQLLNVPSSNENLHLAILIISSAFFSQASMILQKREEAKNNIGIINKVITLVVMINAILNIIVFINFDFRFASLVMMFCIIIYYVFLRFYKF